MRKIFIPALYHVRYFAYFLPLSICNPTKSMSTQIRGNPAVSCVCTKEIRGREIILTLWLILKGKQKMVVTPGADDDALTIKTNTQPPIDVSDSTSEVPTIMTVGSIGCL